MAKRSQTVLIIVNSKCRVSDDEQVDAVFLVILAQAGIQTLPRLDSGSR